MIDSGKVRERIMEALAEEDAFLVDLSIGSDSRIKVLADHMDGMTLERLRRISRYFEAGFDREVEDFELEVSSPGVGQPLKVKEQYIKSVGKPVKLKLKNGEIITGDLINFDEDALTVSWEEKVPKPTGKGKMKITKEEQFALQDIEETSVEIRF